MAPTPRYSNIKAEVSTFVKAIQDLGENVSIKLIELPFFPVISCFPLDTYTVEYDATAEISDFNQFCLNWNTDNGPNYFPVPSLENAGISKQSTSDNDWIGEKTHLAKDWVGSPLNTCSKLTTDICIDIWKDIIAYFKTEAVSFEDL